jgi:hypothetical protein
MHVELDARGVDLKKAEATTLAGEVPFAELHARKTKVVANGVSLPPLSLTRFYVSAKRE